MKIIINNIDFDYNTGCRLLKTKNTTCPFKDLEDIWEDIEPMTFKEIAKSITNLEQRRVAISCLGIDNLVKEISPKLIDKKTIKKKTTWVDESGNLINKNFNDTYELYEVSFKNLGLEDNWRMNKFAHYVKCKDTSTDREYLIWVNAMEVYRTNDERESRWYSGTENYGNQINAIQAVAWTIQTDLDKGDIEEIVRQGDCIMIKKKKNVRSGKRTRHLTEEEYLTLITAES